MIFYELLWNISEFRRKGRIQTEELCSIMADCLFQFATIQGSLAYNQLIVQLFSQ